MTFEQFSDPTEPPARERRPAPRAPGIPWVLVLGLGSMALLWPLTGLTGIGGNGAPRAFAIIGVTAIVWIGVVGFGRVARPVATLALAGLAFGIIAMATSAIAGAGGIGSEAPLWTAVPALAMDTVWGLVAGLIAAAIQKSRGAAR